MRGKKTTILQTVRPKRTRSGHLELTYVARFLALIKHSYDGIALLDANGSVLYAGPSTERVLGYKAAEYCGRNVFDFIHPEEAEASAGVLENLRNHPGITTSIRYRVRDSHGAWRWMEGIGTNLILKPEIAATVWNYRDITSLKFAEDERVRLSAELRQALSEVKALSGLLPICAWCKKIRDDRGYWTRIETYFETHSDVQFTHGICPECTGKHHMGSLTATKSPVKGRE